MGTHSLDIQVKSDAYILVNWHVYLDYRVFDTSEFPIRLFVISEIHAIDKIYSERQSESEEMSHRRLNGLAQKVQVLLLRNITIAQLVLKHPKEQKV